MEDQKTNSETQNPEALVKAEDVKQVQIKNSLDKRTKRTVYKDEHGKFVKTSEAIAKLSAKKASALIMAPSEDAPELTAYEALLKNMMEVATKNTDPKNLIGVAKAVKTLEDATGITAAREAMLKEKEAPFGGIKTIIIESIPGLSVRAPEKPSPTQPSWVRKEAPYIDGEVVQQNAAPNTASSKPRKERRVAQIPAPYCPAWRRATDTGKA
jgi:hypothetical protein